jgi:hypothetical protein
MPALDRAVSYSSHAFDLKIIANYTVYVDFTPWLRPQEYDEYHLPRMIQKLQGSTHVTFGDAVISTPDTCIGAETCVRNPENMSLTMLIRNLTLKGRTLHARLAS